MTSNNLFVIDWTNDGKEEFDLLEQAFNSLIERIPTTELLIDPNPLLRRMGERRALIAPPHSIESSSPEIESTT